MLESKIGKILDRHEEVRREKDALANKASSSRKRNSHRVAGQVKQYEDERRELKARLEKIINRLNGLDIS